MSLIQALKNQRNPYSQEGRTQEILIDELGMLGMANDNLRKAFVSLTKEIGRASKNLQGNRKRIIPSELMESITEIVRLSEERGETIDFIIDLCHILKLDSNDLLEEFWQQGENT